MSHLDERDASQLSTEILSWSDAELAPILQRGGSESVDRFLRRAVTLYFFQQPEQAAALVDELHANVHDPLMWSLATAPEDDEPLDEEDLQAIQEGLDDFEHGRAIPDSELDAWIGR